MRNITSSALRCARAASIIAVTTIATVAIAQIAPNCPYPGQSGNCTMAAPTYTPLSPIGQPQFVYDLPVPVPYAPDLTSFPGFQYYEIKAARAEQAPLAFPQVRDFARKNKPLCTSWPAPAGTTCWPLQPDSNKTWLGLIGPKGYPVFTEVWGYGPKLATGGPLGAIATYPAMSFHASKGTPVKVKWTNDLPDTHLFCPDPTNSNVPCAIDRTLMGAKADAGVTPYGSEQSPDNAMVIHLHGGEIPPDADGFAELWVGNATTSTSQYYQRTATPLVEYDPATYDPANPPAGLTESPSVTSNIDPPLLPPTGNSIPSVYPGAGYDYPLAVSSMNYQPGQLIRPTGNSVVYNYPMVQDPATIWYHDHALGKTRVNVAAGPAGFFIIEDPALDESLGLPPRKRTAGGNSWSKCEAGDVYVNASNGASATYGPGNCFDIPIAFQDRSFNSDGSINFPNALGQTPLVAGVNPLTPGPNPTIHPQWVPEYFGDFAVVNGVIWPRVKVEPRAYRFRMLDGSNARCYTFGMKTASKVGPPAFVHVGSDQGYLQAPVSLTAFTLCPGERADVVIDFSRYVPGDLITITNTANAPFPNGIGTGANTIYSQMAQLLQFQVVAAPPGSPAPAPWAIPAAASWASKLPGAFKPSWTLAQTRTMVLNEVLDPVTAAPLRVQIDGKPFEAAITETPTRGSVERWQIVNTTVDAHPMHLHLVKFRVIQRQTINVNGYAKAINLNNVNLVPPQPITVVDPAPYLMNKPRGPEANENGWKDTAKAYPGEMLTIEAKWDGAWADQPTMTGGIVDVSKPFWEPVTAGPYVWHCHIVDHEDNEMMRPVLVMP